MAPTPTSVFATVGVLFVLYQLWRLLDLVWFHFLRPTTGYKTYLQGPSPYALVTGATDGIGKGVAKDLYKKGFNLILHGRNEVKMKKVVEELKAGEGGGVIRTFMADASKAGHDFEGIVKEFEGLNITVVINNVGGATPIPATLDGWEEEAILDLIRRNATFPTCLMRALLPGLRATSRLHPVFVGFTGSLVSSHSIPRMVVYSACKAFLYRLSRTLDADERFDTGDTRISFMYFEAGAVSSNSLQTPPSLASPSSDRYGEMMVDSIGCGRQVVNPYIVHVVTSYMSQSIPARIKTKLTKSVMTKILELQAKKV